MHHKHIIAPVDGSPFAEAALPYALAIAERSGGKVEMVMVREASAAELVAIGAGAPAEEAERDARAYLDALAQRLAGETPAPTIFTLLEGRASTEIERYARESRANLIVMATHGHGPLSRAWLGSVADHLVRAAPAPVLLIRPDQQQPAVLAARPEFRRIIVPLDGSTAAEEVLDLALSLAAPTDARLILVRVVPLVVQLGSPYMAHAMHVDYEIMQAARAEAERYVNAVADRLARPGLQVDMRVLDGPAAQTILSFASEEGADLIAMRAHGRSGLERVVLGSVTDKVVRGAHRPVLVQTVA